MRKLSAFVICTAILLAGCDSSREASQSTTKESMELKLQQTEKELLDTKQQLTDLQKQSEKQQQFTLAQWITNSESYGGSYQGNAVLALLALDIHLINLDWKAKEEINKTDLPKEFFDNSGGLNYLQTGYVVRLRLKTPLILKVTVDHSLDNVEADDVIFQIPVGEKNPHLYFGLHDKYTHYVLDLSKLDFPYDPDKWIKPLLQYDRLKGELYRNGDGTGK